MRRITLPDITFGAVDRLDNGEEEVVSLSAAQQLYRLVMFAPTDRGFTLEDVRRRLPVGEKLDRVKKNVLLLEDAEHAIVQEAINAASWRGVSPSVIALADAVENAETVNVDDEDRPRASRAARRRAAKGP